MRVILGQNYRTLSIRDRALSADRVTVDRDCRKGRNLALALSIPCSELYRSLLLSTQRCSEATAALDLDAIVTRWR